MNYNLEKITELLNKIVAKEEERENTKKIWSIVLTVIGVLVAIVGAAVAAYYFFSAKDFDEFDEDLEDEFEDEFFEDEEDFEDSFEENKSDKDDLE